MGLHGMLVLEIVFVLLSSSLNGAVVDLLQNSDCLGGRKIAASRTTEVDLSLIYCKLP